MTNNEIKAAAIDKLATAGIWANRHSSMATIAHHIETLTGVKQGWNQRLPQYLLAYADPPRKEIVARFVPPFRPLTGTRHPRADDIERSQPPFMTPRGAIGNGSENSPVWRR